MKEIQKSSGLLSQIYLEGASIIEFMIRAQEGGYWLIAGMNLPLVLSLWYETENLTEKQLETNISEASEGIVLCNKLLSKDKIEEDDEF